MTDPTDTDHHVGHDPHPDHSGMSCAEYDLGTEAQVRADERERLRAELAGRNVLHLSLEHCKAVEADYVGLSRKVEELTDDLTAAREEAAKLRAAVELANDRIKTLGDILREIFGGHWESGHPGYKAVRTHWFEEQYLTRWRALLPSLTVPIVPAATPAPQPQPTSHPHYTGTYCIHGLHEQCKRTCKTCAAPCQCRAAGCPCATASPLDVTQAGTYFCPTSGETESPTHGGFDVCCAAPELHRPTLSGDHANGGGGQ